MPFVTAAGHALEYEWIEGGQPTLVFLHEGLGSIRQWRDFPAHVAAETGCRTLVYNRYGYGNSDVLVGRRVDRADLRRRRPRGPRPCGDGATRFRRGARTAQHRARKAGIRNDVSP